MNHRPPDYESGALPLSYSAKIMGRPVALSARDGISPLSRRGMLLPGTCSRKPDGRINCIRVALLSITRPARILNDGGLSNLLCNYQLLPPCRCKGRDSNPHTSKLDRSQTAGKVIGIRPLWPRARAAAQQKGLIGCTYFPRSQFLAHRARCNLRAASKYARPRSSWQQFVHPPIAVAHSPPLRICSRHAIL